MRELTFDGSLTGWRDVARRALFDDCPPSAVRWRERGDAQDFLFVDDCSAGAPAATSERVKVPAAFMPLAADVACHASGTRWDTLYRVLWRLAHGERHLLDVYVDDDVHALRTMAKAVSREGHKLRAFVRFRLVGGGSPCERYVAWFEPEHDVVAREASFFARRFPAMRWSILTPSIAAHWDGSALTYAPGVSRLDAPGGDDLEDLWRTYYANIFNPARVKPRMMRSEMPVRYWKHLPEATLIAPLLRDAPGRVLRMIAERVDAPAAAPTRASVVVNRNPVVLDADIVAARERSRRARSAVESRGRDVLHSPLGGCDVRVGVASWTDPTMTARGVFYPDDTQSAAARLSFYASRYSLVEVDATYYAMPSRRNSELWVERTPAEFTFDIKAHALMTGHATAVSRLPPDIREALPSRFARADTVRTRDLPASLIDEVWRRFLEALEPLRQAGKLGALLLQMPRDFTLTAENERVISQFRERTRAELLCAVELRHASWMREARRRDRTLALLRGHDLAHVMVDAPPGFETSMPKVVAVTSERLAVVRLHGRRTETWEAPVRVTSERYRYLYDSTELAGWVPDIIDVAHRTQGVHVVFNNCHANYGTTNIDEITVMLIDADELRRQMYRESLV